MASAIPLAQTQFSPGPTTQNAPPAPQPVGVPRPQTMPLAQPAGAPAPQTAPAATSTARYMPHILTRTASDNPDNPFMAPIAPAPAQAPAPAAAAAPTPPAPIPLATGPVAPTDPAKPQAPAVPYADIAKNVPGSNTDYTDKTITPATGVDRLALAKSNLENYDKSTDPEYRASLNEANQAAAGAGQIGSGMLRGRLGDIATTRARDLETQGQSFLNDATSGSIDDQYKNIGIAQQQQGFQQGQQQTAFQQQQQAQLLQEALKNGDFQRYFQLLQAGNSGSPADVQLALSGNYGSQASAAGASAGALANAATRNNNPMPLAAA